MTGRAADGAAAVGADRKRTKSGRHRCDRTAARAARCQPRIPGIARRPEQRIVGIAL